MLTLSRALYTSILYLAQTLNLIQPKYMTVHRHSPQCLLENLNWKIFKKMRLNKKKDHLLQKLFFSPLISSYTSVKYRGKGFCFLDPVHLIRCFMTVSSLLVEWICSWLPYRHFKEDFNKNTRRKNIRTSIRGRNVRWLQNYYIKYRLKIFCEWFIQCWVFFSFVSQFLKMVFTDKLKTRNSFLFSMKRSALVIFLYLLPWLH